MPDDIWNDPDLVINDEYVRFDTVGTKVRGQILSITKHTWDSGDVCPQLLLRTATGDRTWTASQVGPKKQLGELRPPVGAWIEVEFTGVQQRPGGKTLKEFRIELVDGPGSATAAAPAVDADAIAQARALLEQQAAKANAEVPF